MLQSTVVKNVKSGEIDKIDVLELYNILFLYTISVIRCRLNIPKFFYGFNVSNYDVTMMLSKTINDVLYL